MSYLLDCLHALAAFVLFIPIFAAPGYVTSKLFSLFNFKQQSLLTQICLSLALSMAIVPILFFYLWSVSVSLVVAAYFAFALAALVLLIPKLTSFRRASVPGFLIMIAIAWAALTLFSVIDFRIGDRLYVSSLADPDHSYRVELIAALSNTIKLPPEFPFLINHGHSMPLHYHYFWFMLCAVIPYITHWQIGARDALNAGIIWIGYLLLALVGLYWKYFYRVNNAYSQSIRSIAIIFLGGLQILAPVITVFVYKYSSGQWQLDEHSLTHGLNDIGQITYWLDSILWVPNHVAAVIAALLAALALYEMRNTRTRRQRIPMMILAALSLASTMGLSVFVGMPFLIFIAMVAIYLLIKSNSKSLASSLFASLVIALLISAPYLASIRPAAGSPSPLHISLRPSGLFDVVAENLPVLGWVGEQILKLALQPLVFFYELGILLLIFIWAMQRSKLTGCDEDPTRDQLVRSFIMTTLFLILFVNSITIGGGANDFGWRVPLGALFFVIFYGVFFLEQAQISGAKVFTSKTSRLSRSFIIFLMIVGYGTTFAEIIVLRTYTILNISADSARHAADMRDAMDVLRRETAPDDIVQLSPVKDDSVISGLFMERRTALRAGNDVYYRYNAVPDQLIIDQQAMITPIFEDPDINRSDVQKRCVTVGINELVFQQNDPVYKNPRSWIWLQSPLFKNSSVLIQRCDK